MALNSIEVFALIAALAALIKLVIILCSPRAWFGFAKNFWKSSTAVMIVSLVLSLIVLYYLLQVFSIVQIFAVIFFVILISATTLAVYSKEFSVLAEKILKDRKFMKKAWLPILIWLILSLWVLKEIFL